jgi:GT2 family glycosyltransferase
MSTIGAVIVTHNSESEIGACLDALSGAGCRIVVVDNASSDGTVREVSRRPGVELIENPNNRGFAGAVNQAVRELPCPYILLMNPDAVLLAGLEELQSACRMPGVGASGGMLIGPDGRPQAGFCLRRFPTPWALACELLGINRLWPANPLNRRYRCLDVDLSRPQEAEQPAGAFLMFRRDAWAALGGFDESFWPLWFEDVDFLKRMKDAGYRVRYCPAAQARHAGGHSAGKMAAPWRVLCWHASLFRYAQKHFTRAGKALLALAAAGEALLRMAGCAVRGRTDSARAYGKVILFACLWLVSGRYREAGLLSETAWKQGSHTAGRDLVQAHGTK